MGKDPRVIAQEQSRSEIAEANRQLEINFNDLKTYLKRGRANMILKNYPQALADVSQVIKLDSQIEPKSASAYHLQSQLYQAMGDIAKAKADAKKVEELGDAGQEKEP
jgi:tetratricopeptide (TPR) repeat protein